MTRKKKGKREERRGKRQATKSRKEIKGREKDERTGEKEDTTFKEICAQKFLYKNMQAFLFFFFF